jgi:hypothetical protein
MKALGAPHPPLALRNIQMQPDTDIFQSTYFRKHLFTAVDQGVVSDGTFK